MTTQEETNEKIAQLRLELDKCRRIYRIYNESKEAFDVVANLYSRAEHCWRQFRYQIQPLRQDVL